jgi:hypothetical protein
MSAFCYDCVQLVFPDLPPERNDLRTMAGERAMLEAAGQQDFDIARESDRLGMVYGVNQGFVAEQMAAPEAAES